MAISTILIVYCVFRINSLLVRQSLNYNNHLQYHIANDCFRQGTDILTEAIRRYMMTMDAKYIEDYFNEAQNERHREKALEMTRNLEIDDGLKENLTMAMKLSKKLMFTEYHVMHLINDGVHLSTSHEEINSFPLTSSEQQAPLEQRYEIAKELLWSNAYIETKNTIYSYLGKGLENASESALKRHLELRLELIKWMYICGISLASLVVTIFGFILYRRLQHELKIEEQSKLNAEMNVKLKEERDKSIAAEKAKSYFFSTVSHDIRTPLNAIIGFSEMLQLGIDDPKEKEKALEAIITSGHTLLELINDVLDLSKLEAGKMELHPAPTNIANLIHKVAISFESIISGVSVQLHTEVQKMPFLKMDPQRIRQILFNLVGNAVKFTARGFVTIRASYDNKIFTLSVTDTGCGISPENIKKLMSPYVQLERQDNMMGTGLGLAICKQLANQMNGTLEISSTVGLGSTFTLRIPNVEAVSEKESEAFISEHNGQNEPMQLDEAIIEKTILIVDDQKLNQSILRTMLGRLGIKKIITANNGKEALEEMETKGNVDIVLTDMFMPVLDGEGLVREIRKSPVLSSTPVYVITADVETQSQYKEKGFDDILIKPITLDKLQKLLARHSPTF